jgi:hypothetical protein
MLVHPRTGLRAAQPLPNALPTFELREGVLNLIVGREREVVPGVRAARVVNSGVPQFFLRTSR